MEQNISEAKILIVEDEPQINRLIELILRSDGFYKIKKAFDGKEALEIIKSHLIENNDIKGLIYEADIRNEPSLKLIQKLNSLKVEYNEVTDNGKTLKLEKYILI